MGGISFSGFRGIAMLVIAATSKNAPWVAVSISAEAFHAFPMLPFACFPTALFAFNVKMVYLYCIIRAKYISGTETPDYTIPRQRYGL